MRNWRTSLGGAIGVTGITLTGGVVVMHLAKDDGKLAVTIATVGVILSAVGRGLGALFSADAKQLKILEDKVSGTDLFKKGTE